MRLARTILGAALLAAVALAIPAPASAQDLAASVSADADDFRFSSLDVVYELSRDEEGAGTVTVTETFVAEFPYEDQNHGIRRVIPTSERGAPLHPEVVSITDETGAPRAVETETEDGMMTITSRADEFVHGLQTYVLTYTLENVASERDNGLDEFYWDVNGDQWAQEFGRVSAEIVVDPELDDALTGTAACYAGAAGSTDQCDIMQSADASGRTVFRSRVDGVDPHEVMTVAIGFERGTFTPFDASPLASGWALGQIGAAALGVGAVVWAAIVRRRHLRDAAGRPTVIAEFEPPAGWDALRSAVLLSKTTQAIPAELLEQAVAGSVRILETDEKKKGMFSGGKRLSAQLIDPDRADENGRAVLLGLFPALRPGDVFEFHGTSTRFAKVSQEVLAEAAKSIAPAYRRVPKGAVAWPIVAASIAALACVGLGIGALVTYVNPALPVILLIAGVALGFVAVVLVARKPLSSEGAEARDHLKGLKTFMEWAERDRIRALQSREGAERVSIDASDGAQVLRLYEKLLPFAVIFGLEERWAADLAERYDGGSPDWYAGTGPFVPTAFAASVGSLTESASTSSSSGGGSTGGGSAGGGGGGGGGGGV